MLKRIRFSTATLLCLLLTCLPSLAQEGRTVTETFHSPSLEGNLLADSPNRKITIYLPPSYDRTPTTAYPVVYLLHGYGGDNKLWTGGSYAGRVNIVKSMKQWLKQGNVKEMILVMPNSYNRLRGSFYTNSPATGQWADYIAKDLIKYIDNKYRTLPQRESRGIIGHSMGGYGSMRIPMLYPNIFSCMGGMAGVYIADDMLDRVSYIFAAASHINDWAHFRSTQWENQMAFAWSAACVPNTALPPFYCDYPFVYDKEGRILKVQQVYDRFMEHSILNMVGKHQDTLRNMRAIYLDSGTSDSLVAQPIVEARKLHERLESLGIRHTYREFPGDHLCCIAASTGDALETFSKAMAFEMLGRVESSGTLACRWR